MVKNKKDISFDSQAVTGVSPKYHSSDVIKHKAKPNSEFFYELNHPSYGCMNPRCRFIYTEGETKTLEFVDYIKTHNYAESLPDLFQLEYKVWTLDEVVNLEPISGWSPRFALADNGFELVKDIDLFEISKQKIMIGTCAHITFEKNKARLKKALDKIDFENRKLIIYRTQRLGLAVWDSLGVFDIGQYHVKKEEIRKKLTQFWEERQKQEEIERKKRIAYNKANGIVIPSWEIAKKRLDKFLQGKHPENYLFDPTSNTGYDMKSVQDRKRIYKDVIKRSSKK